MHEESIFSTICRRGKAALLLAFLLMTLVCLGCRPPEPPDERVKMTPEEIAEKIGPCVVNIVALSDDGNGGKGSGVIFTDDGYIITNDHVIRGKTSSMEVHLADNRVLKAKLIATDPRMDLAVIKVESDNLQEVKFGNSDEMKKGSFVEAIGNPRGLENSVTTGTISNLNVDVNEDLSTIRCLQTDAAVNHGSSGGALLNEYGELVGINVMIYENSENIGFAIPSNDVKRVVEKLKEDGHVPYPYLGVDAINKRTDKGAPFIFVQNVRDDSPASKAGIQKGDVIFKINDARVEIVPKLRDQINNNRVGNKVSIYIMRKDDEGILEVTLEEIPKGYSSIDWS